MELQLNKRFTLFLGITLTLLACRKTEDNAETANQRFIESLEWNKIHAFPELIVPTDDYFMLSMGDSHVGGTNNLDSFFNIAKTTNPAAITMVGDLTNGHEKDYDVFEQHLPFHDSLSIFLIAGNHDLFYNGWREFYARFGSSTYLFTIKTPIANDIYICLESGGETLGDKQIDWLINILQTMRSNYRRCMVFTHVNFFRTRHTDSNNFQVEELHVLLELFTEYRVDMVITGHDHQHDVTLFGITTYIVMDAMKDGLSNAGYCQIRVKNGQISYEFKYI